MILILSTVDLKRSLRSKKQTGTTNCKLILEYFFKLRCKMSWPPLKHVWTQGIIALCLITMAFISIDLIRKFYHNSQTLTTASSKNTKRNKSSRKEISKFYKITSIVSMGSFTCSVLTDLFDGIYFFETGIDMMHTKNYWLIVMANSFFTVSIISLYIFMFGRLYLIFKECSTEYHLRLCYFPSFCIICINIFVLEHVVWM